MYVGLSIRMEQRGSLWEDFHDIFDFFFQNLKGI